MGYRKMTDIEKNIAREIGYYYLDKYMPEFDEIDLYHSAYDKANKDISLLQITAIEFNEEENIVYIKLHRPGVLIGERGNNIDGITNKLKKEINPTIEIKIIEDKLNDNLYVHDYSDDEEF
jgi:predicted metal-dependent RNase